VPLASGSTATYDITPVSAEGIGGLDNRPSPGRLRWTDDVAVVLVTLEPPPQRPGGRTGRPTAGCRAGPVKCQGGQGMAGAQAAAVAGR